MDSVESFQSVGSERKLSLWPYIVTLLGTSLTMSAITGYYLYQIGLSEGARVERERIWAASDDPSNRHALSGEFIEADPGR